MSTWHADGQRQVFEKMQAGAIAIAFDPSMSDGSPGNKAEDSGKEEDRSKAEDNEEKDSGKEKEVNKKGDKEDNKEEDGNKENEKADESVDWSPLVCTTDEADDSVRLWTQRMIQVNTRENVRVCIFQIVCRPRT